MELAEFAELVTDLNKGIARIETFETTTTEKVTTTTTKSTSITSGHSGAGRAASQLALSVSELKEGQSELPAQGPAFAESFMGMFSNPPSAKDEAKETLDPLHTTAVDPEFTV